MIRLVLGAALAATLIAVAIVSSWTEVGATPSDHADRELRPALKGFSDWLEAEQEYRAEQLAVAAILAPTQPGYVPKHANA
jgi:hypothetical protein